MFPLRQEQLPSLTSQPSGRSSVKEAEYQDEFDVLLTSLSQVDPSQQESVSGIRAVTPGVCLDRIHPNLLLLPTDLERVKLAQHWWHVKQNWIRRTNVILVFLSLLVWEEGENDSTDCCSPPLWNPCRSDQSLHGHLQQNGRCFHRPLCLFLYFYLLPWTYFGFWLWSTMTAVEFHTVATLKLSGLCSF